MERNKLVKSKLEYVKEINIAKSVPIKNTMWPKNNFLRSPNMRNKLKNIAIIILIKNIIFFKK